MGFQSFRHGSMSLPSSSRFEKELEKSKRANQFLQCATKFNVIGETLSVEYCFGQPFPSWTSLPLMAYLHCTGPGVGPEWMVVIWRNVHIAPWPGKAQGIRSINDGLPTHSATGSSTTGYIVSGFLIPFTGPCTIATWMFLFYIAPGSCPVPAPVQCKYTKTVSA